MNNNKKRYTSLANGDAQTNINKILINEYFVWCVSHWQCVVAAAECIMYAVWTIPADISYEHTQHWFHYCKSGDRMRNGRWWCTHFGNLWFIFFCVYRERQRERETRRRSFGPFLLPLYAILPQQHTYYTQKTIYCNVCTSFTIYESNGVYWKWYLATTSFFYRKADDTQTLAAR